MLMAKKEIYTIIVTGAGSGFGALTAKSLAKDGHAVFAGFLEPPDGSSPVYRNAEAFAAEHEVALKGIQLDVTSDESIKTAVDTVVNMQGRIDVIVHNAGQRLK